MFYTNKSFNYKQPIEQSKLFHILNILTNKTHFRPQRYGKGYRTCCPAHNDTNPSLSVSEGYDGRVLLYCFADCSIQDICDALDIKPRDLFAQPSRRRS